MDTKRIKTAKVYILFMILSIVFMLMIFAQKNTQTSDKNIHIEYASDLLEYSQEIVEVNEENFPDKVFREWILNPQNIEGKGSDGILTQDELQNVLTIQYRGQANAMITNLKGIEYFSSLQELIVPYNALTTLDLSKNTNLVYVNCSYNKLTSLNVSNLDKLTTFYCEFNYLKELDLKDNTELLVIYCRHNVLENLDFSQNKKLKFIETFDNKLKEIDVSMLSELEFLHIDHNYLTKLDMSHNLNLKGGGFVARNNDLRELKLPIIENFTVYFDDFEEQDPILGYERLEWYFDSQYTMPVQGDIIAEGQTLYGKRVPNDYTIKFQGSGVGYPSSISAVYDSNVTLPDNIPSRTGYIFSGWCKDTFGKDTIYQPNEEVLNIGGKYNGEQVTLYAQWQPIKYTVSFLANSNDAVGNMQSITMEYGKSYTLPSNQFEKAGYDFLGWAKTPQGKVVYKDNASVQNLSFEDKDNVVLYAVWELNAEETQKPYLEKLKQNHDDILKTNYFSEDKDALQELYDKAYNSIKAAQKDKTLMQKALDEYISSSKKIPTEDMRVDEIVSGWSIEFKDILTKLDNPPVSPKDAQKYLDMAKSALEKTKEENLVAYSSLVEEDSRVQAFEKAIVLLEEDTTKIQKFLPIGEWLVKAELNTRISYAEVLPSYYQIYYDILEEYDNLDENQKQYAEEGFVLDIKARLDIAQAKSSALNHLKAEFLTYSENDYTKEQWNTLNNLYESYLNKICTSKSFEEIEENLYFGKIAMKEVEKGENVQNPDTNPDDDNDTTTDNDDKKDYTKIIVLTISIVIISVVAVWGLSFGIYKYKKSKKQNPKN